MALGQLADALGTEPGHPELAAGRIRELTAGAGATTLSQLGVEASALPRVAAAAAARPELQNTPEPPGEEVLYELLQRAL